jgi:Zn-dependent M28 family amino/carboxypeptidase
MNNKNKWRCVFYGGLTILIACSLTAMIYMPGQSYNGPFPAPTLEQKKLALHFRDHINQFALVPHNSTHIAGLHNAEQFVENQLKSIGYNNLVVQSYQDIQFKNFEVTIEPKSTLKGTVVIGAHYDSAYESPGADDNGSSVVILLELAKRFKEKFNSEHIRLKIVFFTNEEPPFFKSSIMGSAKYAKILYEKKEPIIAMYSFDALGFYSEDKNTQHYPFLFAPFYPSKGNFVGFVGNISSRKLIVDSLTAFRSKAQFPSEGVSAWEKIPGIDYSDHTSFYQYNWPALMVTDTAFNRNNSYHTPKDNADTLDYIKMAQLTDELEKMFRTMYE